MPGMSGNYSHFKLFARTYVTMASSAPSTAEYVTDTSGSSVQIVAPVVDLTGEAIASSGKPPSHTSALSAPVVSVRSSSGRGQDSLQAAAIYDAIFVQSSHLSSAHGQSSPDDLSNPKPGHTTGGSGRGGARRGSRAGRSRAGRDADESVRPGNNCPPVPSKTSSKPVLNFSSEARIKEILCKPMGDQHPRSTRGAANALRSWLLGNGPSPTCPLKPFPCKVCPGMKRELKPGWLRLLLHRRWRTSAWHAPSPRSSAPARHVLRRLRKRCRRRLGSWDPSLRFQGPSPHF